MPSQQPQQWNEEEIKEFRGIASANRNPEINECQICKNLDPREISGDLNSRLGYALKYAAPVNDRASNLSNITTLSFANFLVPDIGGGREVTCLVQKATLNAEASVTVSPSSLNIVAVWIRPYWNGSSWIDEWLWLNEMMLTKISSKDGTYTGTFDIVTPRAFAVDHFKQFTIQNLTKSPNEFAQVITSSESDGGTLAPSLVTTLYTNTWAANNVVLLMRNYIPLSYLQSMNSSITARDVVFHKILNDLRIGFGGQQGRVGLSVGFRDISYGTPAIGYDNKDPLLDVGGPFKAVENFCTYKTITLNPYIPLPSSDGWISADTVKTTGGGLSAAKWFYILTAVLDDYNEFPIIEGSTWVSSNDQLRIFPKLKFGLYNKRITAFKLYACSMATVLNESAGPNVPYYNYGMVKMSDLKFMSSDGYLTGNSNSGFFQIDKNAVNNLNGLSTSKDGKELSAQLGYTPTMEFALSWDQAIVAGGKTFLVNPYIDKRYLNKIFFSPASGDGAFQYDVISTENYYDLENFDGNDLIGIELLPNGDFIALKRNSAQKLDSGNGATIDIELGKGCISRQSIVNFGNYIAWCGENDIYVTDGNSYKTISDKTIRDAYRLLSNKENIIAVREEKDNSYRFASGDTGNRTEYILTQKGWFSFSQAYYPDKYCLAKDGSAWFMKDGNIYAPSGNTDVYAELNVGINVQWRSIKIDMDSLGYKSLLYSHRPYLKSVHLKYSFSENITVGDFNVKVYLDGSLFKQINFTPKGNYVTDQKDLPIGTSPRYFELELNVVGATTPFILHAIGFSWQPVLIGRRR